LITVTCVIIAVVVIQRCSAGRRVVVAGAIAK
jgi:hypothetical protein